MRIAVLSSHTPSLFWFRLDMMKEFARRGCEVFAVGNESKSDWSQKFAENGITYRQIDVQRNGVNPLNDLKTLASVKRVLSEIKPDKIFAYQAKTVIYGGIAARQLGITEYYPLIAGVGSVFLKNDFKTRLIRLIMTTEYKLGMRKSKTVFFQNGDDEQIFRNFGIIKKQPVVRIPGSGVNLNRFEVQAFPEQFGFLCISRLIKDKGVCEFLAAARQIKSEFPDVRFLLVGPFDSNPSAITPEQLQEYIDDGSVEFFGEQQDVMPYLAQCNVYVLPSYREGVPKTNLEAMACGKAILTTDATGCKETVVQGQNGFMVPVRDVEALCDKMRYLIAHPEAAAEMGANSRKMAETVFDVTIVNQKICEAMKIEFLENTEETGK